MIKSNKMRKFVLLGLIAISIIMVMSIGIVLNNVDSTVYAEGETCTVSFKSNNVNFGEVDKTEITVAVGSEIKVKGNTITIGNEVVTAKANENNQAKGYAFSEWNISNIAVLGDMEITANFIETEAKYAITWKNDDVVLKVDELKYDETPTYIGTVPTKIDATGEYIYEFDGWTESIVKVTKDATYTAKFKKLLASIKVEIDKNNEADKNKVDGTISSNNGFASNSILEITIISNEDAKKTLKVPTGKEIVRAYNATLRVNGEVSSLKNKAIIKISLPSDIKNKDAFKVIMLEDEKTVEKDAKVEDGYLVFETTSLGNFAIVQEEVDSNNEAAQSISMHNLLVIITVFTIINFVELILIVVLLIAIKRKD